MGKLFGWFRRKPGPDPNAVIAELFGDVRVPRMGDAITTWHSRRELCGGQKHDDRGIVVRSPHFTTNGNHIEIVVSSNKSGYLVRHSLARRSGAAWVKGGVRFNAHPPSSTVPRQRSSLAPTADTNKA